MELFPYIDSLWFGEGFNYNENPDYWLVEIAGIPYGLFGEMLQDDGNPWRGHDLRHDQPTGLVRRSSAAVEGVGSIRHPAGPHDRLLGPGLSGEDRPQRRVGHRIRQARQGAGGRCQLGARRRSSASWQIDWKSLHLDPAKAKLSAGEVKDFQPAAEYGIDPAKANRSVVKVEDFQPAAEFRPTDEIPIQPGRGWLLVLHE